MNIACIPASKLAQKKQKEVKSPLLLLFFVAFLCLLAMSLVRNGQFLAALGTTSGQYAATISRLHALTETMFVVSLAVVGLECSFHCVYAVFLFVVFGFAGFGNGCSGPC